MHEYATRADVRGVLQDEVLHRREAHREVRVVAGERAAPVFVRMQRHRADGDRVRGPRPPRDELADLRPMRLAGSDEIRPEPWLLAGVRVLAHDCVDVQGVARAGQIQLHRDRGSRGGRLEAAHEDATLAQLARGGLDRGIAGCEADGKDDRRAIHAVSVYLSPLGHKGAPVVRGAQGWDAPRAMNSVARVRGNTLAQARLGS